MFMLAGIRESFRDLERILLRFFAGYMQEGRYGMSMEITA